MRKAMNRIGCGVVGTLFLVASLLASPARDKAKTGNAPTYSWVYAEEASGLLRQIRSLSVRLAQDSDFMELQSRRNHLDRENHALQLNMIREHINVLGEKFQRLHEIQTMIAPWQKKAVERTTPMAVALATHTEGAIACLNERHRNLQVTAYADHVSAMSGRATELASTVTTFLDYGRTSDRLEELERRIE